METSKIDDQQRSRIKAILKYWWGDSDLNGPLDEEQKKIHWGMTPEIDSQITELFKEDLIKLAAEEYSEWKYDKDGRVAAIILADQMSRNMFRKKKEAFDFDHIALDIALSVTHEQLREYTYQEVWFILMVLMHSECLDNHKIAEKAILKIIEEWKERQ